MKKFNLSGLYSILARGAVFFTAYPVLTLLILWSSSNSYSGPILPSALLAVFTGYCGVAAGWFFKTYMPRLQNWAKVPLRILTGAAVTMVMSVWVTALLGLGGIGYFLCLLVFAAEFILGMVDRPVTKNTFVVTALIYALVASVMFRYKFSFSMDFFIWAVVAVSVIFALYLNHSNIDRLMIRRGHSMENLPRKIRYYNVILVLVMAAALIAFTIFRSHFSGALGETLAVIKAALITLVRTVARVLFSLTDGEDGAPAPLPVTTKPPSSGSLEDLAGEVDRAGGEAMQTAAHVLLYLFLALGFILLFSRGFSGIFRKAGEVVAKLRRFFGKFSLFNAFREEQNEYYSDVEEVVSSEGAAIQAEGHNKLMRRWKKRLREYLSLSGGREKFLLGYALSAEGLALHGVEIGPGDTALEILEKSREILTGTGYDVATECYNALKFSREDPPPETEALSVSLNEILKHKPNKAGKKADK